MSTQNARDAFWHRIAAKNGRQFQRWFASNRLVDGEMVVVSRGISTAC